MGECYFVPPPSIPVVAPRKVYGEVHDARGAPRREGGRVSINPRHLHVEIDLELDTDPIRGRLGLTPGSPREFYGWIELAAALEALRKPPPEPVGADHDL
jgi:hypothetical protein